jgi:hypothetical protein
MILGASISLGDCNTPQIDKSFLKPYETEKIKWKIHDPFSYDEKELELSIKFTTDDTTVDFYVYDFGKSQITEEDQEKQLRNGVSEMIYVLKKVEPSTTYSSPMLLTEKMFIGSENLIQKAVLILQKGQKSDSVSIVSMGSDGKCFYKLRYTERIGFVQNFEQYFEKPGQNTRVQVAILSFTGFITLLNEQLMNSGYFN